jgi:hypothetical protein
MYADVPKDADAEVIGTAGAQATVPQAVASQAAAPPAAAQQTAGPPVAATKPVTTKAAAPHAAAPEAPPAAKAVNRSRGNVSTNSGNSTEEVGRVRISPPQRGYHEYFYISIICATEGPH